MNTYKIIALIRNVMSEENNLERPRIRSLSRKVPNYIDNNYIDFVGEINSYLQLYFQIKHNNEPYLRTTKFKILVFSIWLIKRCRHRKVMGLARLRLHLAWPVNVCMRVMRSDHDHSYHFDACYSVK